jgi:hypothetical protein
MGKSGSWVGNYRAEMGGFGVIGEEGGLCNSLVKLGGKCLGVKGEERRIGVYIRILVGNCNV